LGNFDCFISNLDTILQLLYTPKLHIITNGDININYLLESVKESQLENLILSYNLTSIINFPTRIQDNSAKTNDNILLDISSFENYNITSLLNGLSHHYTQLLTINIYHSHIPSDKFRIVTKFNLSNFINELNNESWDAIFNNEYVNVTFNSFLNTYLRIFYSSFPIIRVINRYETQYKKWITQSIKISCKHKRELYLKYRNSKNIDVKRHYQAYAKILSNIIKEAKRKYYDKKLQNQVINAK
jgi:hypothetical protein